MSCDCFAQESDDPETSQTIDQVHDTIDSYTKSLIKDVRNRVVDQRDKTSGRFDSSIITFPAPFNVKDDTKVKLNCIASANANRYEIYKTDEYYGDLGLFDDLCYFGKYSDGMLASSFDETAEPPDKTRWEDLFGTAADDNLKDARRYFSGMIAKPVFNIDDITKLQNPAQETKELLQRKLLNHWEEVEVNNLSNKNQILSALLGANFDGDTSDMWCTLIAFCGYGAHRTTPFKEDQHHEHAYWVNDVTWLAQYDVRPGFEKYGAAAYFDAKYHLTEIFLSHTGQSYRPPADDNTNNRSLEWQHAKWAWKVSVSVATFLVDHLAHCLFRESNALTQAIRTTLPEDHPIRRLLLPFTLGSVYANRVFNEYLRENGLYHRAFAFTYKALQQLIYDSMEDAPLKKSRVEATEMMKYRFLLFRKKGSVLKKLPDQVYPPGKDWYEFWYETLEFVDKYMLILYGPQPENPDEDSRLLEDKPAAAFYAALREKLSIIEKYRFKRFNLVNVLATLMCHATAWNHHCYTAVSFEYSVDPDFTGLKIVGNNAKQNNVLNYVEYCAVVLSKGYRFSNLILQDKLQPNAQGKPTGWEVVLDGVQMEAKEKASAVSLFQKYFVNVLRAVGSSIATRNKNRIAPYNAANPPYCPSSLAL
eukprot:CAMPEP_0197034918 /NCGR_PEP_ID=MMETSP1384-20130603/12845_1 /TAXON_ID=29189 /ORGANISM="Ammonia sp." /LENGTH=645 /DNA_ID=CAMNT_0042464889 /DNA_START=49 /DNA_END=1986 /DNA_ORIENTATION=-